MIRISNRFGGGVQTDTMQVFIAEGLERLAPDVLRLLYRVVQMSDSGLE